MKFIKVTCLICVLAGSISQNIFARLHFADETAAINIQPGYARIRISENNNAQGWSEQSIIPASGMNNTWLSDNTVFGYGAGATQKPPTQFTYNNSNAITSLANTVDTALNHNTATTFDNRIRQNSNTLAYYTPTVRNNSYLIHQNSNALLYGIHNNSTALIAIEQKVGTIISGLTIDQPIYTLAHDLFISTKGKINVTQNCTIIGNGHFILFAQNNPASLQVAADKTLTFSSIALKEFSDDSVSLGSNASIIFGDGTTIALSLFKSYNKLNRPWTFNGRKMVIYGFNKCLDLNSFSLQVTGTLTLQNIIVDNLKHSLLNAASAQSNIILRDSTLNLIGDYDFTTGALEIQKDTLITGTKVFNYRSNRQLLINQDSTLIIDTGSGFNYAPSTTNRDLIYMKNITSRMFLNGCELSSSATAMRLTKGTFLIDGTNEIKTPYSHVSHVNEWISLGNGKRADNLNIVEFPGATKTGDGLIYENFA